MQTRSPSCAAALAATPCTNTRMQPVDRGVSSNTAHWHAVSLHRNELAPQQNSRRRSAQRRSPLKKNITAVCFVEAIAQTHVFSEHEKVFVETAHLLQGFPPHHPKPAIEYFH